MSPEPPLNFNSRRDNPGGTLGAINESEFVQPSDIGSNYRITSGQYIYNLGVSSLGVGTYLVGINIGGVTAGNATFALK